MARTVADAFGKHIADELAKWAIDALVNGELPERRGTHSHAAKIPWTVIEQGRALLEEAGIDWRELLRRQQADYAERCARVGERERAAKIAAQGGS